MSALPATGDQAGPDLQTNVSKVLEVYMVVAGIATQKELATRLDWSESMVSRKLKGKWDLEDLPLLSQLTGLKPADFLREPEELLTALQSVCTATLDLLSPPEGQMELAFGGGPQLALV